MAAAEPPPTGGEGGEFQLIARYFAPLAAGEPGAFGLTDDAAVLTVPAGDAIVATSDTIVEGVHFLGGDPADSIGVKALAVNLSDLAAMGATPFAYLLSIALPTNWPGADRQRWLGAFCSGLRQAQEEYGIVLVGGDTVATGCGLCLTVTALGRVQVGRALRRAGARPGQRVFVSGTIGDAGLGLAAVTGRLPGADPAVLATLIDRYRRPRPRVALGQRLLGLASAAIDISDGLIADLGHLCRQSAVGMRIELERVPLSPAARAVIGGDEARHLALLTVGDDYELAFTCPPERVGEVVALAAELQLPLTDIGAVTGPNPACPEGVRVIGSGGRPLVPERAGYRHF